MQRHRSKVDLISEEELRNIVLLSSTYQDILFKIGYKQTSDKRAIARLKERCQQLSISLENISDDKRCTECKEIKPISDFYVINKKIMSYCKDCYKAKEKEKYKDKMQQLIDFKQTLQCKKCGEKRFYLFDFHHRNPQEKDFTISDNPRASLTSLKEEIDKCDVLCSNCHREWHYLNRVNPELSYDEWLNATVGELV